jgi:hypothetical protein
MAIKKIQIGFRVSEAFHKRIEAESIKRDLSVQDLVTCALQYYFTTPAEWDFSVSRFVTTSEDEKASEVKDWTDIWLKYVTAMPREKILLMAATMKLDLRHYKSSRRRR